MRASWVYWQSRSWASRPAGDDEPSGTATTGAATAATAIDPAPKPAHGAAPWPAPADALRLTVAAGLQPERKETLTHHVHAHLDVFVDGQPVVVPAGIGINIDDPGVRPSTTPDGSAYGGIELCTSLHLAAAHPRQHGHPPHRVGDRGAQHARPVLHRVGRGAVPVCRRLLPPGDIAVFVNGEPTRRPRRSCSPTSSRSRS